MSDGTPQSIGEMVEHLLALATARRKITADLKKQFGSTRRLSLTAEQRESVLEKTDRRCHLCGGERTDGKELVIDHVCAHAVGGKSVVSNYLAAHGVCNRYRWHWSAEEVQFILKLGVWSRKQMIKKTPLGKKMVESFSQHEEKKFRRRKTSSTA